MRSGIHFTSGLAVLAAAVLVWVGCGGGGGGTATSMKGAMSVTLVDGPSPDYKAINLNIQSVQVHQSATASESGWVTLSTPNKTLDLLTLRGGVVETLAASSTLDAGSYQMLRLVLGSGNTLTLADDSTVALTVPSGLQTGIKIPLSFTVQAGTTADAWIDFDGAHSIHVVGTGSAAYVLRPVVQGFMRVATGSVSGTVRGTAGAALSGAVVMAESVDASGNVTILRSTTSDANGAYNLNLLPLDRAFHVVSQPVLGGAVYEAQASEAITLTTTSPLATADLNFTLALGVGGVVGALTPIATASQGDTVYLMQSLNTGASGSARLVIGTVNAVVEAGGETYALLFVPMGSYQVQGVRGTLNADGSTTFTRSSASSSFVVFAGASSTQNIAF